MGRHAVRTVRDKAAVAKREVAQVERCSVRMVHHADRVMQAALGDAPAGTPTNPDLAQRLCLGENGIERHLASIYQAFGFQGRRHQREVIVAIAIHQGIVTRGDINLLPPRQVP